MSTVAQIVRDALLHLGVLDAEEAVEAVDSSDAIRALNLMMSRWEASGLALGWTEVSSPDDDLPAPPEAEEAIGFNLALRLRPRYDLPIAPDVVQMANDSLAILRRDVQAQSPLRFAGWGYGAYNIYVDDYSR